MKKNPKIILSIAGMFLIIVVALILAITYTPNQQTVEYWDKPYHTAPIPIMPICPANRALEVRSYIGHCEESRAKVRADTIAKFSYDFGKCAEHTRSDWCSESIIEMVDTIYKNAPSCSQMAANVFCSPEQE